jgi:hypothetical protein
VCEAMKIVFQSTWRAPMGLYPGSRSCDLPRDDPNNLPLGHIDRDIAEQRFSAEGQLQ